MNVLIIHRYFWPESVSTLPIMLKDIAHFHFDQGDNVSVVCGAEESFKEDYFKEFGNELHVDYFLSKADRDLNIFGRLKNVLSLFLLAKKFVALNPNIDLVYVVSYPPLLAGVISKYIRAKNKTAKVVYIVQDIIKYRVPTSFGKLMYGFFHKLTLKQASFVTTLSESMKSELLSLFRTSEHKKMEKRIWIIPNYSTDEIELGQVMPAKRIDIIYAGNHGYAQNLYHFIDVLAEFDGVKKPKVSFFGNGTERQRLIDYAQEKGVNIDFNETIGREEVQGRMSESRFGLVGAMPGLMRYAFPSKLAAYNAAGTRAILMAEETNEVSEWLRESEFGDVMDPTDVKLASKQLESILSAKFGSYAADDLREKSALFYSKNNYIDRLKDMLES